MQSPAWENSSLDVCFSVCPLLFTCWSCYVGITGFGYSGILPTLNTSSLGSDEVEAQLQRHLSASFAIGPFFGWGQNHWRTRFELKQLLDFIDKFQIEAALSPKYCSALDPLLHSRPWLETPLCRCSMALLTRHSSNTGQHAFGRRCEGKRRLVRLRWASSGLLGDMPCHRYDLTWQSRFAEPASRSSSLVATPCQKQSPNSHENSRPRYLFALP